MANPQVSLTFENAITLTQSILVQMEQGSLSEAEIEQTIAQLVTTSNGARGFFVTYLTDDRSLADMPTPAVVRALQSSPALVADLLVKNLAMSSAMIIHHQRHQDADLTQGSAQVQRRTIRLISLVQLAEVRDYAAKLVESATTGAGDGQAFLSRWGYDAEQKAAICKALIPLL